MPLSRRPALFTIDLANTIFIVCLAVGGVLLLLTVLLDDILGGLLDWLHVDFDLGGVTLMPLRRYTDMSLDELADRGPRPARSLWQAAPPRIRERLGRVRIGDLLDRGSA